MNRRIAKKIWKRPFLYSGHKVRLAARRLGFYARMRTDIANLEASAWLVTMGVEHRPSGIGYWIKTKSGSTIQGTKCESEVATGSGKSHLWVVSQEPTPENRYE
jgi:hypothetical protein